MPEALIIGAGIVGLSVALALQRDGHRVTVLDPAGPAGGASFGNAGWLSGASVVPSAYPGMLKSVPGWLLDPLGPLSLRWRYLPKAAPWLWRFLRAGTTPQIRAQARALRELLAPSVAAHRALAEAVGATHLMHRHGALWVYRTETAFRADAAGAALRRANGIEVDDLDADALRQLEPSLSRDIRFARFISENGHCADPGELCRLGAETLVRDGGQVLRERAVAIEQRDGRVVAVRTDQANHALDWLVLAAGAWSAPLAAQLGDRVPLESERGYHLEITASEAMPRLPIMSGEGKFAVTPMAGRLRLAGTVEFAGLDAPPDWRRADLLLRQARALFPALPETMPEARLSRWLGHRPSTPDSLPVIGRSRAAANAIHAFGHGHVGLAGGPFTGTLVADLIAGRTPPIDLAPFSPGRF
ncbi:MAG TPA: FAD-dependent oxidoreductase [Aliidongia sp.]|uniref:NAD(P)/FAD-dependent oxidoreductase n=1 Tax=Aliidongia sp. TaxID=1914230 RepID=UPI002DDD6418|nr:FAD-dependent oxidoreductase [Aliidongia sp.]HEV2676285.1 FAD-dependent oxidoreductase [Aliidongia sp.]